MNSEYVQYGCGCSAPGSWRNFDASPTLRFERIPIIGRIYTKNASRFSQNVEFGDIVRGLPIPDKSCAGVFCSHVLEHLSLHDFRQALVNTHRLLKAGACFRLVLPDLEYSIAKYVSDSSADAVHNFMRETSLGREKRNRGFVGFVSEWLGNSQHLWMWDFRSIAQELATAGFESIRRAEFGDATDERFNEVEVEERWKNCLGVECRKAYPLG